MTELDWMRRQPQVCESESKARLQNAMKPNQQDSSLVLQNSWRRIGNQILQVRLFIYVQICILLTCFIHFLMSKVEGC